MKYVKNVKYEVDILDGLKGADCSKYIAMFSLWAHFTQMPRSVYVERLQLIKASILRLQKRCPGATVVVKGPHVRFDRTEKPFKLFLAADYLLYEMNTLMRNIFRGIGVNFIDIWDMNLAYPVEKNVHMPRHPVIEQELGMFLSHVCND